MQRYIQSIVSGRQFARKRHFAGKQWQMGLDYRYALCSHIYTFLLNNEANLP